MRTSPILKLVLACILISSSAFAQTGPKPSFQEKITTDNIKSPGYFGVADHKQYDPAIEYNDNALIPEPRISKDPQNGINLVTTLIDEDVTDPNNWLASDPNEFFLKNVGNQSDQRVQNSANDYTESMTPHRLVIGNFDANPRMDIVINEPRKVVVMKNFDGHYAETKGQGLDTHWPILSVGGVNDDYELVCGKEDKESLARILWTDLADANGDGKTDIIASVSEDGNCKSLVGYWAGKGDGSFEKFKVLFIASEHRHTFGSFVPFQGGLAMTYFVAKDQDSYLVVKKYTPQATPLLWNVDIKAESKMEGCLTPIQVIRGQFSTVVRDDYAVTCPRVKREQALAIANQAPQNALQLLQMKKMQKNASLSKLSSGLRINRAVLSQAGNIYIFHKQNLIQTISEARGPYGITTGDYNNDGQNDIAFTAVNARALYILRNKGDGQFEAVDQAEPTDTVTTPRWIQTHDFNEDGRDDIALVTNSLLALNNKIQSTIRRVQAYEAPTAQSLAYADVTVDFLPNSLRNIQGQLVEVSTFYGTDTPRFVATRHQKVFMAQRVGGVIMPRIESEKLKAALVNKKVKNKSLSDGIENAEIPVAGEGSFKEAEIAALPQDGVKPASFRIYLNEELKKPTLTSSSIACESVQDSYTAQLSANGVNALTPATLVVNSISPDAAVTYNEGNTVASIQFNNTKQSYEVNVTVTDPNGQSVTETISYPFADCATINTQEASLSCPAARVHNIIENDTIQICAPASFAGKNITWRQSSNTQYKLFDESNAVETESNCVIVQSPVFEWNVDFTEAKIDLEYEVENVTGKLVCQDKLLVTLFQVQGGAGSGKCTLSQNLTVQKSLLIFTVFILMAGFLGLRRKEQI